MVAVVQVPWSFSSSFLPASPGGVSAATSKTAASNTSTFGFMLEPPGGEGRATRIRIPRPYRTAGLRPAQRPESSTARLPADVQVARARLEEAAAAVLRLGGRLLVQRLQVGE